MNMRFSTIILSLALAGALAYAGYLRVENARLRAVARDAPLAAEPSPVFTSTDAEAGSEALRATSVAATSNAASPEAAESQPAQDAQSEEREGWRERRRERMERMAAAFDDPEMRLDMVERQIQRVDQQYAGFFKTLNLSREELDTLRTLMAERSVIDWETRMRGFAATEEGERERVEAAEALQHQLLDEEIEAVLGDDEAERLRDYADSLPYRSEVEALATSLSFTKTPLSEQQTEHLVRALQDVSSSFEYSIDLSEMRGREARGLSAEEVEIYFQERATRDTMVFERAASALNDEQLAAFVERQMADRERERRHMEFMLQNQDNRIGGR